MANILHYASSKNRIVWKLVLAAELFASTERYDAGHTIAHALSEIIGSKIDLTVYTDSRSLHGLCISLARTSERCLLIDLAVIQQAYERRVITVIVYIYGKTNSADGLTKVEKSTKVLE